MQPRNHTERLGIALKVKKIKEHLGFQYLADGSSLKIEPAQILFKPVLNRSLPKMSKGRVSNVMDQPGALKYVAHSGLVFRQKCLVLDPGTDALGNILSQGLGQGGHLQGVGKPCPHKITPVQRKHLGLVLKAAEGGASDDAVVILLKLRAQVCG